MPVGILGFLNKAAHGRLDKWQEQTGVQRDDVIKLTKKQQKNTSQYYQRTHCLKGHFC